MIEVAEVTFGFTTPFIESEKLAELDH